MTQVEVLFFDVLGTVVDPRGSLSAETTTFLERHDASHIDAAALADAWIGRHEEAVESVRAGRRPFVPLDVITLENLEACLLASGLSPSSVPPAELEALNRAWRRLTPWPDSVEGLCKLKQRFIVVALSDASTRILADMAKHAGLPWDAILGADISRAYKPTPQVYLNACALLGVAPDRAMLVAAHDYDLDGARRCGLKTAFIPRDNGQDLFAAADDGVNKGWDFSAGDLTELAELLK
jgi:2-haloacid dehalogenase